MTTTPEQLHDVGFPGESEEYRRDRESLLRAELDLRTQTEAVAAQRRRLPLGGAVPHDYAFREWDTASGTPRTVKLSELFEGEKDTLFLYSFSVKPGPDGDPLGSTLPGVHLDHRRAIGASPPPRPAPEPRRRREGAHRAAASARVQPRVGEHPHALVRGHHL